jgi:hypothetical protein
MLDVLLDENGGLEGAPSEWSCSIYFSEQGLGRRERHVHDLEQFEPG